MFRRPYLLTLTIDPKGFASPEEAHNVVAVNGYIRRLMKLLGIRVWVWVLEFQKNGWPHWHILVDLSDRGRLRRDELQRIWRLWRDKWGLGGFDIQERKSFLSAKHAVLYITKYLTKPASRYPRWFLVGKRRRMCQGSRSVGRLSMKDSKRQEGKEDAPAKRRRQARSLVNRMAECGMSSAVLDVYTNVETGEQRACYVGRIDADADALPRVCPPGSIWQGVGYAREPYKGWGFTAERVVVEMEKAAIVEIAEGVTAIIEREELLELLASVVDGTNRYLDCSGYSEERARQISQRREEFLNSWIDDASGC